MSEDEIRAAIRPVEWVRDYVHGGWYGNAPFPPHYRVNGNTWQRRGEGTTYVCDDEAQAKTDAQADFERRVMSAFAVRALLHEGQG